MKVGFFLQGPHLIPLAETLIESVRRVMPDVPVVQLTDGKCPGLVDEVIRIPEELPMGVRRVTHYTRLEGEWCFCGVDVLFQKDVRHVFHHAFDVALASREGTYMERTKYAVLQPYNFDILFSRSPEFWKEVLRIMKKCPPALQDNGAEQVVTCMVAEKGRFKTGIIPSDFNYTPKRKEDDFSHASILHLKGRRKEWIPEIAQKLRTEWQLTAAL